jgi:toxin ParE1/3/4
MQTRLSEQAMQDLFDISIYTLNNWGEKQKDKYLTYIQKRLDSIATYPRHGKLILKTNLYEERVLYLKHHVVYYLIFEDFLFVERIVNYSFNI